MTADCTKSLWQSVTFTAIFLPKSQPLKKKRFSANIQLLSLLCWALLAPPVNALQDPQSATAQSRLSETHTKATDADIDPLIERVRRQALLFSLAGIPEVAPLTRRVLNMNMSFAELETSITALEQLWQAQGLALSANNNLQSSTHDTAPVNVSDAQVQQSLVLDGVTYDAVIYEGVKDTPAKPERGAGSVDNVQHRLDMLEALPHYSALIGELRRLTQLSAKPWDTLELSESLRPGDETAGLENLQNRLVDLGDLSSMDYVPSSRYEGELITAVKHFQRRHGLAEDGVVGPKTLKWLNMPPQQRAERLARGYLKKNRESRNLPSTYVLVNIPQFWLELVDEGQQVLESRVIVGRVSRPTPLLEGMISAVVVNPSWRVPRKLIRQDILPKVRFNGAYLAQKGFTVNRADGSVVSGPPAFFEQAAAGQFPYTLEQRPGPRNSLGRFKLHFDNNDSIYLHDTPERNLFNKADRALSSGCIRVEKIAELADWFASSRLNDQARWQRSLANWRSTRWFTVKQPVPVKFVYWTSWMDANGESQFREDIYAVER